MKRLVYFPAGRAVWMRLAETLHAEGTAEPVIWLGDKRHEAGARARFPAAHVLPMDRLYFGDLSEAPAYRGEAGGFLLSDNFARARERAGKMLDRVDRDGVLKAPSREVYLTRMALWGMRLLDEAQPEALVMAESPHAPATYLLYELCLWAGMPTWSFMAWSLAPGVGLRPGIAGPMRPAPDAARHAALDGHVDGLIEAFAARMAQPAPRDDAPDYMLAQTRRERKYRLPARLLGRLRRGGGGKRALRGVFADDAVSAAAYGSRAATRVERTDALRAALARVVTPEAPGPYVFVPLHYEPERTTNPDGGAFHDQLRALATLRAMLPPEVGLRVKEHPSQLMVANKGFLGRSPAFYGAAAGISGLSFAPMEVPARRLIEASRGVATVTGTAALEAALLGRPALVFGTPWFEGCPNTVQWRPGIVAGDWLNRPVAPAAEVVAWLKQRWRAVGLVGTVNPSTEKLHAAFYDLPDSARVEADGMAAALRAALEAET